MKITLFEISQDRSQINLTITDALTTSSLKLWTNLNYKDYSKAIDLSNLLTGVATENIAITLSDLGITYFDGVYFIEATDPDEVSEAVTSDLTRYEECILTKILNIVGCEECLKFKDSSILNAQTLLYSLKTAINNSFIDEIVNITKALDKYCTDSCKTCGEFTNILDSNYYSSNQS